MVFYLYYYKIYYKNYSNLYQHIHFHNKYMYTSFFVFQPIYHLHILLHDIFTDWRQTFYSCSTHLTTYLIFHFLHIPKIGSCYLGSMLLTYISYRSCKETLVGLENSSSTVLHHSFCINLHIFITLFV